MILSLVTINYNNAAGLRQTLRSVAQQSFQSFQHIIIDGGSTDDSVDIIKDYASHHDETVWCSEPDNGIYNAINKGILRATGTYIQILNSGDRLASCDVLQKLNEAVARHSLPDIIYGNMVRVAPDGRVLGKSRRVDFSLLQYFVSTMNHDCCWIRRQLFDTYGLYDENLKIVSDWKWFLQVIALGGVEPLYIDLDVTLFDCTGISECNMSLRNTEREQVLSHILPPAILADYKRFAFPMEQVGRLQKYHLYTLLCIIERFFFKLEKWHILS